ncbi:hypothetical protein ACW2Q0_28160 [Nocardia sp. R16R-3T]
MHLGDGTTADINSLHELHVPSNYFTVDGGGESYEFMPFTSSSGLDLRIWNPVTGVAAQAFSVYMTNSWAEIGAAFINCVGIRFMHAPATYGGSGNAIQICEFANPFSFSNARATFLSPIDFNGTYLRIKIWVDDDQFIRVWMNDTYLGSGLISDGFKLGPGRRCVRFLNSCLNDVWISNANGGESAPALYHYDRPTSFPASTVYGTSVFYDDFNRANGAVGNGWTVLGSAGQIVSNSYATTGGTDGSRAIIRNTGITNGRQRVEAVVGGALGPNNSADSSLLLCGNSAGTQGLACNVFGNAAYISRYSSSLSGSSPTFTDFASRTDLTINNGDTLAFNVYDGAAWLEQNGTRRLYAVNVNDVVPASNSWGGLRVERAPFNDSLSWNDCRILST